MGCGSSVPEEYEIPRTRSGNGEGFHRRRRASIEASVPMPMPAIPGGKRYPKNHHNKEKQYPEKAGRSYVEFPTDYKPHHYAPGVQNSKGRLKVPGGPAIKPGHTRTITDQHGKIHGVSYHPKGRPDDLYRAAEIRKGKVRRFEMP